MAKVHFLGLQELDFETKEGDTIKGLKLHLSYLDDNVMGFKTDTKFISQASCKNLGFTVDSLSPLIGKDVELETNINGKVTGVIPVDKSN